MTNSGTEGARGRLTVDGTPIDGNLVPYAAGARPSGSRSPSDPAGADETLMTAVQEIEALAPSEGYDAGEGVVTIRNGSWELDVLPATGASIAGGRICTTDGVWRDLLRPTRRTVLGEPEKCSSFPMVPWSNRISDGVLPFGGRSFQLQRNGADGTAIHGAARHAAWSVVERTESRVVLELDTTELIGINFPWKFRAQITYALTVTGSRSARRCATSTSSRSPPASGTTRTCSAR